MSDVLYWRIAEIINENTRKGSDLGLTFDVVNKGRLIEDLVKQFKKNDPKNFDLGEEQRFRRLV